jgi:RNA-binding protein YhbY
MFELLKDMPLLKFISLKQDITDSETKLINQINANTDFKAVKANGKICVVDKTNGNIVASMETIRI